MYRPSHFDETRVDVLHTLIAEIGLGAMISHDQDSLEATHLPFLIEPAAGRHGRLIGHVARANPHWRRLDGEAESLIVFQGPHGYVSPSWYPSKQADGRVVPTWNYAAVHAYGHATTFDNPTRLRAVVAELTEINEKRFAAPWSIDDAPRDFTDRMLAAIVGIEVQITRLEGKLKLSQNRPDEDRQGVLSGLAETGSPSDEALQLAMRRYAAR
jgi:transcriptional regulator